MSGKRREQEMVRFYLESISFHFISSCEAILSVAQFSRTVLTVQVALNGNGN